jgi:GTP-dependent dephospho-CoA kinase
MLTLPEEHRKLFQEPFGDLHRNINDILPLLAGQIVYSVGDVVTHNLQRKGITPDVAIIDGFTMRVPCSKQPCLMGSCIRVKNPAGTLTEDLINAVNKAIASPPVTIVVDGEEDLAVIPVVMAAPQGSIVLYGQPHKGIVLRRVTPEAKLVARQLLERFTRATA